MTGDQGDITETCRCRMCNHLCTASFDCLIAHLPPTLLHACKSRLIQLCREIRIGRPFNCSPLWTHTNWGCRLPLPCIGDHQKGLAALHGWRRLQTVDQWVHSGLGKNTVTLSIHRHIAYHVTARLSNEQHTPSHHILQQPPPEGLPIVDIQCLILPMTTPIARFRLY